MGCVDSQASTLAGCADFKGTLLAAGVLDDGQLQRRASG
jgi:hypothetical protein